MLNKIFEAEKNNEVFCSSLLAPKKTRANKATRRVFQNLSRLDKMTATEKITKEIRRSKPAHQKNLANFRLATINVGSLFGQGAEVANIIGRRVKIAALQEVLFKNEGVRWIGGGEYAYKLF